MCKITPIGNSTPITNMANIKQPVSTEINIVMMRFIFLRKKLQLP